MALLSVTGLFTLFYGQNQTKKPKLSYESGLYEEPINLNMKAGIGAKIYYTLDGSNPTRDSILYNGEAILLDDASAQENRISARTDMSIKEYDVPDFNIDKSWCIKAKAFYTDIDEGSEIVTANYLVKSKDELAKYRATDVIFLTMDPVDLIDYDNGMMVKGAYFDGYLREEGLTEQDVLEKGYSDINIKANYARVVRYKFEKKTNLQHFRDGDLLYEGFYGIRNRGSSSSNGPKKTYNLFYREEYSDDLYNKDIFLCKKPQDKMVLKREDCLLRDSLYEALFTGTDMKIADQGVPVQLFINGEYWGLYSLEEKLDENWYSTHIGVPGEKVTVVKNHSVEIGKSDADLELDELIEFCQTHDMSEDENYNYFCDRVDIDSFLLYYAAIFYLDARDFLEMYNTMQWRVEGEKWQWSLYDLDNSAADSGQDTLNEELKPGKDNPIGGHIMFSAVMENPKAQELYVQKVQELKEILSYEKVCSVLEGQRETIVAAGLNDNRRWGFEVNWDEEITRTENFFKERPLYVDAYVEKYIESKKD